MSIKKTLSRVIFGATLLATGIAPANAHAVVAAGQSATGTTTMTVTMPEYIVLRYYQNINLNFTASSSTTVDKSFEATLGTDGTVTYNADIAEAASLGSLTKNVTLNNVWSIAGLSPSGTAKVSITGTSLTNGSGEDKSTIGASKWQVSASDAKADETITTSLRGSNGGANRGNVIMDLDFSKTTKSGAHTGTFTITAQTI
ncbi:MAG TPA: hypothetical protein DEQ23_00440 [Chlorobium sp.]|uniref:DUF4402 domain-containing protein n=1 Tax=Chlorobium phaeovibrioides (strain DSM 265 / 1930) TaxID=290318 RepID=A4SEF6_CHLPM|nr:hypothetical protein [Chlorobium sp.]